MVLDFSVLVAMRTYLLSTIDNSKFDDASLTLISLSFAYFKICESSLGKLVIKSFKGVSDAFMSSKLAFISKEVDKNINKKMR